MDLSISRLVDGLLVQNRILTMAGVISFTSGCRWYREEHANDTYIGSLIARASPRPCPLAR